MSRAYAEIKFIFLGLLLMTMVLLPMKVRAAATTIYGFDIHLDPAEFAYPVLNGPTARDETVLKNAVINATNNNGKFEYSYFEWWIGRLDKNYGPATTFKSGSTFDNEEYPLLYLVIGITAKDGYVFSREYLSNYKLNGIPAVGRLFKDDKLNEIRLHFIYANDLKDYSVGKVNVTLGMPKEGMTVESAVQKCGYTEPSNVLIRSLKVEYHDVENWGTDDQGGIALNNSERFETEGNYGTYVIIYTLNATGAVLFTNYSDISVNGEKITITSPTTTITGEIPLEALPHEGLEKVEEIAPTCDKLGQQAYYHCSICGKNYPNEKAESRQEITDMSKLAIPADTSKHIFKEVIDKAATTTETGIKHEECSVCGMKQKEGTVIEKLPAEETPGTPPAQPEVQPRITLNANSIVLKVKQSSSALKATDLIPGDRVVSWKTSNKKVFTVSKTGKLKAGKKPGKANLTITLQSGLTKTIPVKVQKSAVKTKKVTAIKTVTLQKGQKFKLIPVLTPITTQEKVKFTSSKKKVATVNSKGQIVAKKAGKTVITIKSGKKTAKCTVIVR